jgi:hypothetical protein
MEEFRIARSHGPELVFLGVCVTTARNGPEGNLAMGRWHEISVYRRADNAWLASINRVLDNVAEHLPTPQSRSSIE